MESEIPKQFIKVNDCPVIIHTLLKMQNHSVIDKIQVVCIARWENILLNYAQKYNVSKLNQIVTGRILHDSVRPLVTAKTLSDVISVCKIYGNSMSVLDCTDTIYEKTTNDYTSKESDRNKLIRGQTPEAVTGKRLKEMYAASDERNIRLDSISALQLALGWEVYFAKGSELNIKITRPEDLTLFKALAKIIEQ